MLEFIIPLLSALITGLLVGLAATSLSWGMRLENPWQVGAIVGSLAALTAWLYMRARAAQVSETIRGYHEPPPAALQPVKALSTVRVELGQQVNGSRWMDFIDLDGINQEALISLARGLHQGRSMALTLWTGRGHPFTRSQFESIRQAFIDQGLARWRSGAGNPQQGAELTARGRAVMRGIVDRTTPPQAQYFPKLSKPL